MALLTRVLIVLLTAGAAVPALAQQTDLTRLSVQDLLGAQVSDVAQVEPTMLGTAASVYVIARGDIVRTAAETLADLLRLAPGISVAQADATTWRVTARGSEAVIVLLDGQVLASPLFGGLQWDLQNLPLREIERVEVVRGASGASWGVNGVTTVINIVSRSWNGSRGGLLTGGVQSSGNGLTTARYVGPLGNRWQLRVVGGYAQRGTSGIVGGVAEPDSASNGLGDVWLRWKSDRDVIRVRGFAQRVASRHLSRPGVAPSGTWARTVADGNIAGSWSRRFSARSELTVQSQYRASRRVGDRSWSRWELADVDGRWRHQAGRHGLVAGGGFRTGTLSGAGFIGWVARNEQVHTTSAFVHDDIAVASRWQLTPGMTIEHSPYGGLQAQPTIRLVWRPTPAQSVWWAASRGVGSGRLVQPFLPTRESESTFRSEFVRAQEAGYRLQAGALSVDVAAFLTEREDRLGTAVRFESVPEVSARGVEVAASARPVSWWGLTGSYSLLHLPAPAVVSGPFAGVFQAPRHQTHLRSVFVLSEQVELNAELFRVSAVAAPRSDAYTKLDLRFEYEIGENIEVSFGARDLFHGGGVEFPGNTFPSVPLRTTAFAELEWQF
jgi:iron complex outermembrane receptor protein